MQYPPEKPCPGGRQAPPAPQSASREHARPAMPAPGGTQAPLVQSCVAPQRTSHPPQWALSDAVLMHDPLHNVIGAIHGAMIRQTPPKHPCPAEQGSLQFPQCRASARRFTHVRSHTTWGAGQLPLHPPSTHRSPDMQAPPQAPQWASLTRTSTHAPPHRISPAGQGGAPLSACGESVRRSVRPASRATSRGSVATSRGSCPASGTSCPLPVR